MLWPTELKRRSCFPVRVAWTNPVQRKSGAKVLLFFDMTKFLRKKIAFSCIFSFRECFFGAIQTHFRRNLGKQRGAAPARPPKKNRANGIQRLCTTVAYWKACRLFRGTCRSNVPPIAACRDFVLRLLAGKPVGFLGGRAGATSLRKTSEKPSRAPHSKNNLIMFSL